MIIRKAELYLSMKYSKYSAMRWIWWCTWSIVNWIVSSFRKILFCIENSGTKMFFLVKRAKQYEDVVIWKVWSACDDWITIEILNKGYRSLDNHLTRYEIIIDWFVIRAYSWKFLEILENLKMSEKLLQFENEFRVFWSTSYTSKVY